MSHLYAKTSNSALGVIGVDERTSKFDFSEGHQDVLQLLTLVDLVKRHPNATWYVLLDDDHFVNADNLLKSLDKLTPEARAGQKLYVSAGFGSWSLTNEKDM